MIFLRVALTPMLQTKFSYCLAWLVYPSLSSSPPNLFLIGFAVPLAFQIQAPNSSSLSNRVIASGTAVRSSSLGMGVERDDKLERGEAVSVTMATLGAVG